MNTNKIYQKIICLGLAAFLSISGFPAITHAEPAEKVIMPYDMEWSYSDDGKDLGTAWMNNDYDYSGWKKGKAPFGFGDAVSETNPNIPLSTEIGFGNDENNKHMTTYAKTEIEIDSLESFEVLEIYVHVDDGALIYFNGAEAFRKGIDEDEALNYNTPAKFSMKEETFVIPADALKAGKNIIAAEIHQDGGDSSDLWFEMSITALEKAPVVIDYTTTPIPNPNVEIGEVSRVTVSFKGDTKTSKGFTWYTTQASADSDLQIIEKTDEEEPSFENAVNFTGIYQRSTNAPQFVLHKAEATGLKPDTEYQFRVGDASLDLWSEAGSFKTAGSDGKFTFINLADSQAKSEVEAELSADTFDMANETVEESDFMVINGDIVDTGLNEDQWGWVLDKAGDSLLNTTFVAAAGNHDEDPKAFIEHFNLNTPQGSSTETGAYYSYDYENAHFIVLNNNEDSEQFRNFTPEQIEWLKADAAKARADKKIDWIITVMHKGPYTTSNHATDDDIMDPNGVRSIVAPLFNKLGIDLVLQGHDHIYALTKPIKDGKAVEATKLIKDFEGLQVAYSVDPDGTIYMIPSTAGPKVYYRNTEIDKSYFNLFEAADEHSAAKYGPDKNDPSRPVRSQIQNFIEFNVDGNKLTGIVYEIDKSLNDGKPFVIDSFGIIKDEASQTAESKPAVTYSVKPGDMLWKIALRFGTTYQGIQKFNNISDPHLIYPGQVLLIPEK